MAFTPGYGSAWGTEGVGERLGGEECARRRSGVRMRRALWAGIATLALVVLAGSQLILDREGGLRPGVSLVQLSLVDESAINRANHDVQDAVSFVDMSARGRRGQEAAQLAASAPSGPVPDGHEIHVDLPATELNQLKVGSIVKGQVRRPMLSQDGEEEFNTVDFTGKVRSLQLITVQGKVGSGQLGEPDEGVVTVKMLSDQFIAPGTAVTGMVAGKIFKGTVTKAPSFDERMDEAEKRARELSPPVCDELCQLNKSIAATAQRIQDFETSRKMRSEAERLEKRTYKLEHPPPPPETVKIVGNWAGFKFEFPQGPNQYGPRIKAMKDRLGKVDYQYAEAFKPLYKETQKLEKRLDDIEGKKTVEERIGKLSTELEHMENCMLKFTRKQCIQQVIKRYGYVGYKGREAVEEEEKDPFIKPEGKIDEVSDFKAKGELVRKVEPEEEEEEEEEEDKSTPQSLAVSGKMQSLSLKSVASHAASRAAAARGRRAEGHTSTPAAAVEGGKREQEAVWKRYMAQASKMDGIHSVDNVMAGW